MAQTRVDICNFTSRDPSRGIPLAELAQTVLPGWEISLVFAGEQRAKTLNMQLRGKDYIPNVLSFESGKKSGEIIICPKVAARQARSYGLSTKQFIAYLFIHGLFHLKGHPHGATMERYERALMARFDLGIPQFN